MVRAPSSHRRPAVTTGRRVFEAQGTRSLLVLAVPALVLMAIAGCRDDADSGSPAAAKPNVLLITLDTTRADFLGCYGRTSARTPNLDRLAREGTRFDQCSSCTSLTAPSHASILTGQYPFAHGVRQNGRHRVAESTQTLTEVLKAQGYRTHAIVAASVLNRHCGLDQGFDVYQDLPEAGAGHGPIAERRANAVTSDAVQAIQQLAAGPFFLWVHFYDPHYPYESSRPDTDDATRYEEEIARVDTSIGVILECLRQSGVATRTLIVVVADHGEGLGEHGESFHGYFTYETTLRVPLLYHGVGVAPNHVVNATVRTIDIGPTILALVDAPALKEAQGVNLASMVKGGTTDPALVTYAESMEGYYNFKLSPLRVLRIGTWKHIEAPRAEMYQLGEDPDERNNQIHFQADRAAAMREQLRNLIAEAPPPPSVHERTASLGAAERARLESLGYIQGAGAGNDLATELDTFAPGGPDPKDKAEAIEAYCQSVWALSWRDYPRAEQLLRKVVQAIPESARAHADLAYAMQRQDRIDEAILHCDEALRHEPTSAYVRRIYAGLFMQTKRWAEAEGQLKEVLTQEPADSEAWHSMGVVLAAQDRPKEAQIHFEQAVSLAPRDVQARHALGVAYARVGEYAKAALEFRRVLEIDPGHARSREYLQRVQELMKENPTSSTAGQGNS